MPPHVRVTPPPSAGRLTTVPELLTWRSSQHRERTAIEVHGVAELTFGQWEDGATRVAAALRKRGIAAGDRVGLLFGPREWNDFAIAYCGVQRAGAVAVPMSDRLAAVQILRVLGHCGAGAVVHGVSAALPAGAAALTATVGELTADAPGDGDTAGELNAAVRASGLAQILYTSGTTGAPKGVGATHANLTLGVTTDLRRLPLGHSARFVHAFAIGTNAAQTMLFNALQARPSALTLPQFTPARFARLIESSGAGTVFLVPSAAIELLNSGALDGRDLSGVHLVGSTAAALPPAVAGRLARVFSKATIVNYYTSTEAAPAQTSMIFDPDRPGAVGRAVDGTLMIADESGEPLPAGEVGEVWMRSPYARSYFRDEEATRAVFRGSWVRMGDVGHLDAQGYLYLADRDQDIVKSGAFKISTLEIESALYEHPQVAEAAVVGVPHPVLGASVAAVLVAGPGAGPDTLGLPAIRGFLATRLADYQLPTRVLVLDGLPRNEAGKVLKRQLVARFAQPVEEHGMEKAS